MRWQSESWLTKAGRLDIWHRWFAWHPVRAGEEVVWLEDVERKGELMYDSLSTYWAWEYRSQS